MNKLTILTLAALIFILSSCAMNEANLQESGARLLSQEDLVRLYEQGNVNVKFDTPNGSGSVKYLNGGKVEIKGNGWSDEGHFINKNGVHCTTYNKIRTEKKCFRVYHIEGNKYVVVNMDGSYNGTLYVQD